MEMSFTLIIELEGCERRDIYAINIQMMTISIQTMTTMPETVFRWRGDLASSNFY